MPPPSPPPDRRLALLDATLRLIGDGGLGAVTHRRVEAACGLPHGSTTYYFKTKQSLLEAAIARLLERDRARGEAIAQAISRALAPRAPLDSLDLSEIARGIVAWIEDDRTLQLARYELFVEAARSPRLGVAMTAAAELFITMLEPLVVAAGSRAPQRDARIALGTINGLMFEQLARPRDDFATEILPIALRKLLASFDEG